MTELEQRLERILVARAETVVAGQRLSGDKLVQAGRAARKRRRQGIVAAVAAGALAVVVGASVLAQTRSVRTDPVPPGSAPASSPPAPQVAPTGGVPIASLGVDVAAWGGNRVIPAEGAPFTMPLPAGHGILELVRVPSGWVMLSTLDSQGPEAGHYLWFVTGGLEATSLGRLWGNYAVSRDGGRLVVAAGDADRLRVAAYELPELRYIGDVRVEGFGPMVDGIAGDWVVLSDVTGDGSPTPAHIWNLRTNQLRSSDEDVNVWGVTHDGRVLRRVLPDPNRGCVDVVAATGLPTVRNTGLCSDRMTIDATFWAEISPDGVWVMLPPGPDPGPMAGPVWVRAADLRAGRWRPVASGLPESARPVFWDTDRSVIVRTDEASYLRCWPPDPCVALAVPVFPDGTVIVERRG
jgi:hypothetical protein